MHTIALLLLPEFSNLGVAAVTEPLFVANWLAQRNLFEWRTISEDGRPVRASNGALLRVDGDLQVAVNAPSVFVFASFEPSRAAGSKPVLRWLQRLSRHGAEIGGIENGTQALAAAGLLHRHTAAIHWDNLSGFQELYPRIQTIAAPYSFSSQRVTCAGAAATLEMMVAWIGLHADTALAAEVSKHLLLRTAAPARGAGSDTLMARLEVLMRSRVDEPMTCNELAQRLGLSLRQIERRCKREWGRSLHQHYMSLRMERAHQLLQQTSLTVTDVAVSCGFRSAEYFAKLYRAAFGCRPSTDRQQSTSAPVYRSRRPTATTAARDDRRPRRNSR